MRLCNPDYCPSYEGCLRALADGCFPDQMRIRCGTAHGLSTLTNTDVADGIRWALGRDHAPRRERDTITSV
jgi:hypothetical protein